jgi:hypothetical protein
MPPLLVVSFFGRAAQAAIIERLAAGKRPPGTGLLVGTYGINEEVAAAVGTIAGAAYAPMFSLDPRQTARTRAGRHLDPASAKKLDQTYAGALPPDSVDKQKRLVGSDHRNWGLELGRRFRDRLRSERAAGIDAAAWQFDEILGECGDQAEPNHYRQFVGGVVRGLAQGRTELGDQPEPGVIWAAWSAMQALPPLTITPELQTFWLDVGAAARVLAGEEYVTFDGDPASRASEYAKPQQALARSGGKARMGLANRYVVGMTPGWKLGGGLGGNIHGWPLSKANAWRSQFIAARMSAQRPSGYAQFSFIDENAIKDHVHAGIDSLHEAAAKHVA